MDDRDIRNYAGLMQELDLTGLEITQDGCTVRLERAPAGSVQIPVAPPAAPPRTDIPAPSATEDLLEIRSPMVGVFYAASAENAAPFVKPGDRVKKGDVLCVIEAMKLMNEITAEQACIIEEVCVGNNQVVDFDHVLFRCRRV